MARHARGTASELMACVELMQRGFYVFRCESPHAPFDLVAYQGGVCHRVEVKTLNVPGTTAPSFPRPANSEWDLLALVAEREVLIFDNTRSIEEIKGDLRERYGFPRYPITHGIQRKCRTVLLCARARTRSERPCDICEARTAIGKPNPTSTNSKGTP